jgi:hypothetical protein
MARRRCSAVGIQPGLESDVTLISPIAAEGVSNVPAAIAADAAPMANASAPLKINRFMTYPLTSSIRGGDGTTGSGFSTHFPKLVIRLDNHHSRTSKSIILAPLFRPEVRGPNSPLAAHGLQIGTRLEALRFGVDRRNIQCWIDFIDFPLELFVEAAKRPVVAVEVRLITPQERKIIRPSGTNRR